MAGFLNYLRTFFASNSDDFSDFKFVIRRCIRWYISLTVLMLLLIGSYTCRSAAVTFLIVAAASTLGGAAIGFLFGLPKTNDKRKDDDDSRYNDNTNLQEVSDWITKIIVGLTLIKLKVIIGWIDQSAHSIELVFSSCPSCHHIAGYVIGYCTIIFYFLAGAGMCYLWARTTLSKMFDELRQQGKRNLELMRSVQALANTTNVASTMPSSVSNISFLTSQTPLTAEGPADSYPSPKFKSEVEAVYNSRTVIDQTDKQRARWGGSAQRDDFLLEGSYISSSIIPGVHRIKISVKSVKATPQTQFEVAFFIHDTFPQEIVFAHTDNNLAFVELLAFEAFVVGAKVNGGPELELDLNQVKGFPEDFYWGKK